MSLTTPPKPRALVPGEPLTVVAVWQEGEDLGANGPMAMRMAVLDPLGIRAEYRVTGVPAEQLFTVNPAEDLPFFVSLAQENGRWTFSYQGQPADFRPASPTPMSPEQLSAAAEAMLRESLGLAPGEPIPLPAGELPPAEQPEPPRNFDPTPHMDLGMAEAAPALPPPAPPGPEPAPGAQTAPVPQIPPPANPVHGGIDLGQPFAH
jgi:hypothetical protein